MSTLNKLIGGAFGVAFGARALDDTKPVWARIGYGLVAADLLRNAFLGVDVGTTALVNGAAMNAVQSAAESGLGKVERLPDAPAGKLNFQMRNARTMAERVAFVHEQMIHGTKDPKVYSLARKILTQKNPDGSWKVPEKNAWAEICALFDYVQKNVRYTWDPTAYDAFQTPAKTLELSTGDCDDAVSTLGAMLRSVGYHVRSRIVQTKDASDFNHIYLLVELPNGRGWKALDTTVKRPAGWEVPMDMVAKKQDYAVVEN